MTAHSRAQERTAAEEPFTLAIGPYVDVTRNSRPERKKGRRKADYDVTIANDANAPVTFALDGEDADAELRYSFDVPPGPIPPGHIVAFRCVSSPKQIWIGRTRERRFSVIARSSEQTDARHAIFRQRPWLPWWLIPPAVFSWRPR